MIRINSKSGGSNWIKCVGCNNDRAWALVKDTWIYRISFSKELIEHINNRLNNEYTIQSVDVVKGKILSPGEKSKTGGYCLIDTRKDRILRVSLDYNIARLLCDFKTRYLTEARIKILKG